MRSRNRGFSDEKALLRRHQAGLLGFLDQRADPVDLLALGDGLFHAGDELVEPVVGQSHGADGAAAGRLFGELRDVHVAEGGQHPKCAGWALRS